MFLGRGGPGPAKCEKKVHPNPEDDQNAKNKHAWKRRLQTKKQACKQRPKKRKKKECSRKRQISQILNDFGNDHKFCFFFYRFGGPLFAGLFFFAFWPAAAARRACVLRFGRFGRTIF